MTIIDRAIYHTSNCEVVFGKNQFLGNPRLNDSTSQIYPSGTLPDNVNQWWAKTLSLDALFIEYHIDPNNVSIIKVDIENGEEHFLADLFKYKELYNIPLLISFHVTWWTNKDVTRFRFFNENHIKMIDANPFITLLFE